jgi:hypothetical protein
MIPDGFLGEHIPRSKEGMASAARVIGCDPLVVQALIDIETGGHGFLTDGRPKILCERHHFAAATGHRFDIEYPQISSPTPGGYYGGASEYLRLKVMLGLDHKAALESTSWGLPQILGSNHKLAGFDDVEEMVEAFCLSEDIQLGAMANFIVRAGLADELQREDFADFATRYNGPNYQANAYDKKLAADLSRLRAMSGAGNDNGWPAARQHIAKVQAALNTDGYGPLTVDGWLGSKSTAALRRFQNDNHLMPSGQPDKLTEIVLLGQAA